MKKQPDKMAALGRALVRARDVDAQTRLLEEAAGDGGSTAALAWQLTRSGALPIEHEATLWSLLAESEPDFSGADVAALLAKITDYPKAHRKISGGISGLFACWPSELDRLACLAYARDPAPLDAAWPTFPPLVEQGFATLLRKFDRLPRDAFGPPYLREIAQRLIAATIGFVAMPGAGGVEQIGVSSAAFVAVPRLYGEPAAWGRVLLEELATVRRHGLDPRACEDAFAVASAAEMPPLLAGFHPAMAPLLSPVLLEHRHDAPAELLRWAEGLDPSLAEALAVVATLRAARAGDAVDPTAARWIDLRTWAPQPGVGEPMLGVTLLAEALWALPRDVAASIVESRLRDPAAWRRALPFIGDVLPADRVAAAVAAVRPLIEAHERGQWWVKRALERIAATSGVAVDAAPAASPPASALSPADRIRAAAAGSSRKPVVRIFLLAPGDGPPATVSRIGGAPVGVTEATWPRTGKGKRPMEHLLTLAAADLDGASLPGGAAAISLFIRDRQQNAASRPDTDDTRVVVLSAADLAAGAHPGELPAGSLAARALELTAVDVPADVFDADQGGNDLLAIRRALRIVAGHALGAPRWLQDPEHDGDFVLQFRAALVPMNLGDDGVMYVFTDAAFWQAS